MTEKCIARLLGGYETTVYPTALGDMWAGSNVHGTVVKVLGPQECTHYLTAQEARDAAAALTEIADGIEAGLPAVRPVSDTTAPSRPAPSPQPGLPC